MLFTSALVLLVSRGKFTLCSSSGRPAAKTVFPILDTIDVEIVGHRICDSTSSPTSSAVVRSGRRSYTWVKTLVRTSARGPPWVSRILSYPFDPEWGVSGAEGENKSLVGGTIVYLSIVCLSEGDSGRRTWLQNACNSFLITCVASCSPEIRSYVLKHCRKCVVDWSRRASTSKVDKSLLILALILSIRFWSATYTYSEFKRGVRLTGDIESTILQFSDWAFSIRYLSCVYSLARRSTNLARSVSSVFASRASARDRASKRRCRRSSKAYF